VPSRSYFNWLRVHAIEKSTWPGVLEPGAENRRLLLHPKEPSARVTTLPEVAWKGVTESCDAYVKPAANHNLLHEAPLVLQSVHWLWGATCDGDPRARGQSYRRAYSKRDIVDGNGQRLALLRKERCEL